MRYSTLFNLFMNLSLSAALLGGPGNFSFNSANRLSNQIHQKHFGTRLSMSSADLEQPSTRRQVMKQTVSLLVFTSASSLLSDPAKAKDKEAVTREGVAAAFQAVRDELESPEGGVKILQGLVEKEDFAGIMEFTKGYDLEFRKAKMGKARKFVTGKEEKDLAVLKCNAVTFDLIGMNKGSRPGQQDINQVKKYFSELEADIISFLEMERGIDFSEYGL